MHSRCLGKQHIRKYKNHSELKRAQGLTAASKSPLLIKTKAGATVLKLQLSVLQRKHGPLQRSAKHTSVVFTQLTSRLVVHEARNIQRDLLIIYMVYIRYAAYVAFQTLYSKKQEVRNMFQHMYLFFFYIAVCSLPQAITLFKFASVFSPFFIGLLNNTNETKLFATYSGLIFVQL